MSIGGSVLQVLAATVDVGIVETPSFTFRLERVRTLRERAEERAREELATELRAREQGAAMLEQATYALDAAREAGRDAVGSGRVSATNLVHAQAYLERREQVRVEAMLDLDRQDAEVAQRRRLLAAAARDRQAIERLKERRKAEHDAEWSLKIANQLDELALGVFRRGGAVAA
jgi:flagellar protein FliJ